MNANSEQLVNDLKTVARDAEDLIKLTADEVSDKVREARTRLATAVQSARENCQQWEDKAVAGMKATDKTIRAHPYETVGVAFGFGLLFGLLLARK